MEVDLSDFFGGKCTLSRMGACRVPPGSVAVLSPSVPSQMSVWNNNLTLLTFMEQSRTLPLPLSSVSDSAAFSLTHSALG